MAGPNLTVSVTSMELFSAMSDQALAKKAIDMIKAKLPAKKLRPFQAAVDDMRLDRHADGKAITIHFLSKEAEIFTFSFKELPRFQ